MQGKNDRLNKANLKKLDEVIDTIGTLDRADIECGFLEPDIATYMFFNEYGTKNGESSGIPPRPGIDFACQAYGDDWIKKCVEVHEKLAMGNVTAAREDFKILGARMIYDTVLTYRTTQRFKPNAPSTIERKGHDRPMLDKGTAINSIDAKITAKIKKRK